ncbi:glycosyltransferase family 4 protein [Clostridium baratii]|uniref:glycosyltransferase family 4 protein n=1 Tax=Clostridium baratii TaxID=1561 RepID=UPI001C012112|nr:glycosyltransferase family 4 protein [Clostridium baratii]MBT9830472.1 glycosyltransferase [Clostridium baratii]MDY3207551.1 glycosyltransferase family 4 protein [Clostridium baratii]
MKILFITPGKLPVPAVKGGAVENLIQLLLENNELIDNNEISVISSYDYKANQVSKNYNDINFFYVNTQSILYKIKRGIRYLINRLPKVYVGNEYIYKVNKFLKKNNLKYDMIIIENSPEYILKIKHKFSNKVILHTHNDFINKHTDQALKILHQYDGVFSLSEYISNRVREIDSNYNKVYTLYNGIDTKKFCKKECNINYYKNKFNISNKDFVYIYTGRITPEKGVKELIIAFKEVYENNKFFKLIICGDFNKINNKNRKYIKDLKKMVENNQNIICTGYIEYDSLSELYNIANIGVIPSIWEEPFALTVIENMSCGNPVIVSKSGGMVELVTKNEGIIVDKNNDFIKNLKQALLEIKNKKYNPEEIIKHAQKFSKENYQNNFIKYIKEV